MILESLLVPVLHRQGLQRLVGGGVAVAAATVLAAAHWLCGLLWRRRRTSYEKLQTMGEEVLVAQAA